MTDLSATKLSRLKFSDLEVLLAFEREGFSLAQAAHATGLSPSSISMKIAALETMFGIKILERERNRYIRYTGDGSQLMAHVRRIFWELTRMGDISPKNAPDRVSLVVATSYSIARYKLPGVVRAMMSRYPTVDISIEQAQQDQIVSMVDTGTADIGLLNLWDTDPHSRGVVYIPYGNCRRVGIAPQGNPLGEVEKPTFKDLSQYNIITYSPNSPMSIAADSLRKMAKRANGSISCGNNSDIVKAFVREGCGISILPDYVVESDSLEGLTTFAADHLFPRTTFYGVLKQGVEPRQPVYELLREVAPHLSRELVNRMAEG